MKHDESTARKRAPEMSEAPTPSGASGGSRTRAGSNYGDWHPDEARGMRGYDGSKRSGDWPAGDKETARRGELIEELDSATSPEGKDQGTAKQ